MPVGVEVDTSNLERYVGRLSAGLTASGTLAARGAAEGTAAAIRSGVPRRSGRLAGSVGTTTVTGGYAVTYGTGVPYASYIEKRTHAVETAATTARVTYPAAMAALCDREARRAG